MGSRLMVKMNDIYQSQIILLNWMFVPSLYAYCYHLVTVICLGLSHQVAFTVFFISGITSRY